jgi:acyl-CoA synthetase (AMP-forming)/AMP-acid ligase II
MSFNLADLFEQAVDVRGDEDCLVVEGARRSYNEMEANANRLAHHLQKQGVKANDHVGIYAQNCVEWVESIWAILKIRAVFVNINYRYVERELSYLFDNSDIVALIYSQEYSERVKAVIEHDELPLLKHIIVIEDGSGVDYQSVASVVYNEALAHSSPERDFEPRSENDHYILYTGGTTGMPKGVLWNHRNALFAFGGGTDMLTRQEYTEPEQVIQSGMQMPGLCCFPVPPLMHAAGQLLLIVATVHGRKSVLCKKFDAKTVLNLVAKEKVNIMFITGDAMAIPLSEELAQAGANYDLSSLIMLASTAVSFSPEIKKGMFQYFPNAAIADALGSSEGGQSGMMTSANRAAVDATGGTTIAPNKGTLVVDDNFDPVLAGSGIVGKVARKAYVPIGYYKDPVKSAETFITVNGERFTLTGDHAVVESDGSVRLLGRGTFCINTGGEKVYPEEVEGVIKSHAQVYDALVVGVEDRRWGSKVTAVVALQPGATLSVAEIQQHCRDALADYKVPKQVVFADAIERFPNGKPDYSWAKQQVLAAP